MRRKTAIKNKLKILDNSKLVLCNTKTFSENVNGKSKLLCGSNRFDRNNVRSNNKLFNLYLFFRLHFKKYCKILTFDFHVLKLFHFLRLIKC